MTNRYNGWLFAFRYTVCDNRDKRQSVFVLGKLPRERVPETSSVSGTRSLRCPLSPPTWSKVSVGLFATYGSSLLDFQLPLCIRLSYYNCHTYNIIAFKQFLPCCSLWLIIVTFILSNHVVILNLPPLLTLPSPYRMYASREQSLEQDDGKVTGPWQIWTDINVLYSATTFLWVLLQTTEPGKGRSRISGLP